MRIKLIITFIIFNFNIVSAESLSIDPNKISKNLRCLVCQGQSIADSNSEFAQTIKLVIKDQLKEGKSEEAIYDFLIKKYGEWIVYKPPYNKVNFLLLTLPYILFVLGGILIFFILKKSKHNQGN